MTGNSCNPGPQSSPILVTLTILGLTALALQGCASDTVTDSAYTVSSATSQVLHQNRQEFRDAVDEDYISYRAFFSAAECKPEQYRISPELLDYLEQSDERAQDILMETYRDQSLSQEVRAHALYLAAIEEVEKAGGSEARARKYLKQVKREFPGTHDCAVEKLLEKDKLGSVVRVRQFSNESRM